MNKNEQICEYKYNNCTVFGPLAYSQDILRGGRTINHSFEWVLFHIFQTALIVLGVGAYVVSNFA